jgi:hypothetical protein
MDVAIVSSCPGSSRVGKVPVELPRMTKGRPRLHVAHFNAPGRSNLAEIADHENLVGLVEVGEGQSRFDARAPSKTLEPSQKACVRGPTIG